MTDLEPPPPPESRPRGGSGFPKFELSRVITIAIAIVLATMFLCLPLPRTPATRIHQLEDPVRVAVHTFERDIELDEAVSDVGPWLRRTLEIVMSWPDSPRIAASNAYAEVYAARAALLEPPANAQDSAGSEAIPGAAKDPDGEAAGAATDVLDRLAEPVQRASAQSAPSSDAASGSKPASGDDAPSGDRSDERTTDESNATKKQLAEKADLEQLQIRRAVLLAEADQWDEADQALQIVDDEQPVLADLVRRAYGDRERMHGPVADDRDAAKLRPGWVRDRLELRLAEKRGDVDLVERMRSSAAARGDVLRKRTTAMTLLFAVPCALGLLVLCAWLLLNRPEITTGSVAIPPPWSWERGFAILVRSAFAGLGISTLLYIASSSFDAELMTVWTTLIASIPMMWWILHYLVEPSRLTLVDVFGLGVGARQILGWTGVILSVIAIDQLGTAVITVALRAAGIEPHWSEFVQESFIFGSTPFAALSFIDGAVWAPLFEEIGCRGLLYLTIRRRLGPTGAALLSAMLFGAVHLYSLPGLLSVCWSGVVYALAVERCRSLLPAISAHAFNNAFALGGSWLFYRVV